MALLWERFAGVIGLDPQASYAESETTNASLGGAEVTMLRRLNLELQRATASARHLRGVGARDDRQGGARPAPGHGAGDGSPGRRPAIETITSEWLTEISGSGVDVVGDLEDLRSVWPDDGETWTDPDLPDPEVVADAAIQSLAHVLDELGNPSREDPAGGAAGAPPARLIAHRC